MTATRMKRAGAVGFTVLVVMAVLLVVVLGSSYRFQESVVVRPGERYVYELDGYSWTTLQFTIRSTGPVTVCITDGTGLNALYSGGEAICLFKVDGATNVDRVWRFPKNGPLYLVVIPKSKEGPVSLHLNVKGGVRFW
ncbi:hypothetical protein [Thermococcus celer]|nr:hypothetical protein [Thermococcus celer]